MLRWIVLLCRLITMWLMVVMLYVPAPLGLPLLVGWNNIAGTIWLAALALTFKEVAREIGSREESQHA